MFYKIKPDEFPIGVEYRLLSTRTDLFNDCHVIETKDTVDSLDECTEDEARCIGDTSQCIVEFTTKEPPPPVDEEAFKAEQSALVEKYYGKTEQAEQIKAAMVESVAAISVKPIDEKPIGGIKAGG